MVINQNENAVFVFKEGIEIMLNKINMICTDNERFRNEILKDMMMKMKCLIHTKGSEL